MNLVTIRIDGTVASHVKDEFDPSAFDTTMPPQLTAGTPFTLTYVIDTNSQDSAFDRRRGRYTGSVKSAEVRIGTWSYIADISASLNSVYCPRADEPCGSNAVEILDNFFAGGPIGFGSRQEDSYRLRIRHQLQTNLYDRIWLEYEFRSTTSMPGPSPTLFHSDVVQQQVPNASSPIFTLSTNRTAPDAFRREEIRGVGSSWTIVSGNMPEVPPIPSRFVSGGKEWRRLDEFAAYFFSASDVRNVCPGDGRCSGSLAGISLDGWTWASDREVAEMLESASGLTLGTLTSLTGTASYLTSDRTYALAAIDKLGFTYSGTNQVGGTGYTRSVDSQTGYAILVGFGTSNPNLGSSVDAFGRSIYPSGQRLDYFVGAYFYRSIAGP
jgi:hypothetical protein